MTQSFEGYRQAGEQTVGWSGHGDTSRDAEHSRRRRYFEIVGWVTHLQTYGATWREVAETLDLHHGEASGPLSVAHKDGHLVRLKETRAGCGVYVHPDYVAGRETVSHGSTRTGERRQRDLDRAYSAGYGDGFRDATEGRLPRR